MMFTGRRCKRKFGGKKVVLLTVLGCLTLYIGSVIHRSRVVKGVWSVHGFPNITDGQCGPSCGSSQLSFYIKTGEETKNGPIICIQGQVVVHSRLENVGRGMNIAIVNDKTFKVELVKTYDTYLDDYEFLREMKTVVKGGNLAFIASYDEITESNFLMTYNIAHRNINFIEGNSTVNLPSLSEEGHRWLKLFGSEQIDDVIFRDGYMLVGQKGLKQGHAIEFIERRGEKVFADPIEKLGCISLPLGPVSPVEEVLPRIPVNSRVKRGPELKHCGMSAGCHSDEIPMMVSTGTGSKDLPEVCVNSHMIMGTEMNNAGRGINVVVVDSQSSIIKSASTYDTYEKNSLSLELMLEALPDGDIVIMVAFDDGSRKLSSHARDLVNALGSSMVQNLKFRDVWYFVGQKGMKGYTSMEMISYAGLEAEWPKPLKNTFCVPKTIIGSDIIPDPPSYRNDAKRDFCKKYDGYSEFCDPGNVDSQPIKPVTLLDKTLQENPVYSSPIIIIPGFNHNALVRTMETTVMQPGVSLQYVLVAWDEMFPEHADLADLFGFRNVSILGNTEYTEHVRKAIEQAAKTFPQSTYLIVLEEEIVLSPDFLLFMAQCSHVLHKDDTLLGAAAFNYNGFESTSSNKSLVYRVHEFPGLGFMLKMDVYRRRMKGSMAMCCNNRFWDGWSLPLYNSSHYGDMLVPDVSRLYRQPYEGVNKDEQYLVNLFNQPRETNVDRHPVLSDIEQLHKDQYDSIIKHLLTAGKHVAAETVKTCTTVGDKVKLPSSEGTYVLYFHQKSVNDYTVLVKIKSCFNMVVTHSHPPRNLYKGIIRMTFNRNNIMLVGSNSEFAHFKPQNVTFFDGS